MSQTIMLYYGVVTTVDAVAALVGTKVGSVTIEQCDFCEKKFSERVNFCPNCGADCRLDISSLTSRDVLELMTMKFGPPPRGLSIDISDNMVVIGQMIGKGVGMAHFAKDPGVFMWKAVSNEVKKYAAKIGITPMEPAIVAIAIREE